MNAPHGPRGRLTFLVDLRVAQYNGDRGIPAYSQSLVRQICLDHPDHRYLFLWDDRLPQPGFAAEFERYGTWALESELARGGQGRIDVLFTACFFLPLNGRGEDYLYPRWLRSHQPHRLGIVYDLIPYLFRERYLSRPDARTSYLAGFRVLRDSDRLFAISQATRLDTIRLAGIDPTRIRCVYGDIDHRKRTLIESPAPGEHEVPARFGLRRPYAVYIGGDDWRKNMDGMVYAYANFHARHPDIQLAVICKLTPRRIAHYQLMAASLGIRPGALVFTDYVTDEDLVALTRRAELMAYPSLYEGLGLPVLEAYGCGIPVVGSNSSSIKELVIPELMCDPREPLSVAAAMSRLVEHPELRERSLDRGRRLLEGLGWRPAARAVIEELEQREPPRGDRVAVVGALPDAQTAIAACTLEHLQSDRWHTDFFDANPGPTVAADRRLLPGNRILPVEVLAPSLAHGRHGTVVFVLGNSPHHVKVLEAALRTRLGCRQRRLAYLHEVNLGVLLRGFLGSSAARPAEGCRETNEPWIRRALEQVPDIGRSLRFLLDVVGFDGLIVNSDACRRLIRAAVGPAAARWSIDVAFLPIMPDRADRRGPPEPAAPLHVGTFGTGGDTKQLPLVAQAVSIIARRRPVRLTIAGWSMARVCRRFGISKLPFVMVHDSPADDALAALMRSTDVAVQLRTPTHGESSAAVHRLIGLGTPVVVTGEGSFAELPPAVATAVQRDCPPAALAAAIEEAAVRRPSAAEFTAAIAAFSPAALEAGLAGVFHSPAAAAALRKPA